MGHFSYIYSMCASINTPPTSTHTVTPNTFRTCSKNIASAKGGQDRRCIQSGDADLPGGWRGNAARVGAGG